MLGDIVIEIPAGSSAIQLQDLSRFEKADGSIDLDFAEGFAESLSCADRLILLDIYPAREEPIPGVTSEIIFKDVASPEKVLLKKGELMDYLAGMEFSDKEVVVTVGAGDIDRFVEPIAELLNEKVL